MPICKQAHRYNSIFISLPHDQGGDGRHKCCGCAYDQGYRAGLARTGQPWVDLAEGYRNGVNDSYRNVG